MSKYRAHTTYRNDKGVKLPGVTTITGELGWNKQVLMNWANRLGLEGIKSEKYKDDKAEIGTLAHTMVTSKLRGEDISTDDYSKNQIKLAENSAISYYEWEKGKIIEPILVEELLISNEFGYGGTPDFYGKIDGKLELVDYKTGKGIYNEYLIQVTAYKHLLEENGHKVDKIRILNIPRGESESFQQKQINEDTQVVCWEIFQHCLAIYKLKKQL